MLKKQELIKIIDEFKQPYVQSEAEVRSKFIVPIIQWLGYPQSLRAEEFPVYGFEGRKKLPTKDADFILFDDAAFGNHKKPSEEDIDWVHNHSLLVVEAKKTREMPELLGQPQYYTIWTKAVAYFATDGVTIRGRIARPITADMKVVDCSIDQLPDCDSFLCFSFENTRKIKETGLEDYHEVENVLCLSNEKGFSRYISPDEEIDLSDGVLSFIKHALGKNADGLTNYQLLYKYLAMTDAYLQNDLRYNIPSYMINIPRYSEKALLYTDNSIFPCMKGEVCTFYRDEVMRYDFQNDYVLLSIIYICDIPSEIVFGYKVLDMSAKMRLQKFHIIKKLFSAKRMKISFSKDIVLKNKEISIIREKEIEVDYWIQEMKKILAIEDYYGIGIKLKPIDTPEESFEVYQNIDIIYSGIKMQPNFASKIQLKEFDIDMEIDEPVLLSSDKKLNVPDISIHGISFTPQRVYLVPMHIAKSTEGLVEFHYCFQYDLVQEKTSI